MDQNLITKAIEVVGLQPLARGLGISYQALRKWEKSGYLPRTEWSGETDYSLTIERLTHGKVKARSLLKMKPPQKAVA